LLSAAFATGACVGAAAAVRVDAAARSLPALPALTSLLAEACGNGTPAAAAEVRSDSGGHVRVLCPSVERVANNAVRARSACRREGAAWRCEGLDKEFSLVVNGRRTSIEYPATLDSFAAWQMTQAIAPMAVPLAPQGHPPPEERCRLSGDHSDLNIARMTLRCRDWTVEFVRLCDAAGCRHVPASRTSNAAAGHDAARAPREPR
jgi:hypothetical protein